MSGFTELGITGIIGRMNMSDLDTEIMSALETPQVKKRDSIFDDVHAAARMIVGFVQRRN